jgi:hypothetical protein
MACIYIMPQAEAHQGGNETYLLSSETEYPPKIYSILVIIAHINNCLLFITVLLPCFIFLYCYCLEKLMRRPEEVVGDLSSAVFTLSVAVSP